MEILNETLNVIPIVGQFKTILHCAFDDEEEAEKAFTASTIATSTVIGGALGIAKGGVFGGAAGTRHIHLFNHFQTFIASLM